MAGGKNGGRPAVAFILVLIGGIFIFLVGLALAGIGIVENYAAAGFAQATGASPVASFNPFLGLFAGVSALTVIAGAVGLVAGIATIVSAVKLHSADAVKVRRWSIAALILSVISLAGGGGLVVGFLLALIGGILGLIYKG